jgi:uncharacterized membrane protein
MTLTTGLLLFVLLEILMNAFVLVLSVAVCAKLRYAAVRNLIVILFSVKPTTF